MTPRPPKEGRRRDSAGRIESVITQKREGTVGDPLPGRKEKGGSR